MPTRPVRFTGNSPVRSTAHPVFRNVGGTGSRKQMSWSKSRHAWRGNDDERSRDQSTTKADPQFYWLLDGQLLAGEYPASFTPEETRPKLEDILNAGIRSLSTSPSKTRGSKRTEMRTSLIPPPNAASCVGVIDPITSW